MIQFAKNLRYLFATVIVFATFPLEKTCAQLRSPNISLETYGIVSSSGTTPFWLQSNRHGMFSGDGSQFMTRIQAHSTDNKLTDYLTLSYGADFITRPGSHSAAWFNQGYVRFDAWNLFMQAGRFYHVTPGYPAEIGLGSVGVSGNATPVPQIRAGLADWTSIPLTNKFIQIRGHIAHGWLGSRRYTEDVFYQETVGHANFGGDLSLNLYAGIHHFVAWGGNNHPTQGDLPSSLKDFGRVFFALSGGENAPTTEENFKLGAHTGIWDFGFTLDMEKVDLKVYRHFLIGKKGNLKFKNPEDALMGFHFKFSDDFFLPINELVYENMYTKDQDGPLRENTSNGVPCSELPPGTCRGFNKGNENFYNNGLYRTGFTYQGMTIGNALFKADPVIDRGVSNNRIVAHHLGFTSRIDNFLIKPRITYSRNYGTHNRPYENTLHQWSLAVLVEARTIYQKTPITLSIEPSYDNGTFVGNQLGIMAGIKFEYF